MVPPIDEHLERIAKLGSLLLERRAAVERAVDEYEKAAGEMRAAIAKATEPRTGDDLEDAITQFHRSMAAPAAIVAAAAAAEESTSMRNRALAFINAHPSVTYTAGDIAPQIGVTNLDSLRTTLSNLANDEEILRGEKRGEYRAKGPIAPQVRPG